MPRSASPWGRQRARRRRSATHLGVGARALKGGVLLLGDHQHDVSRLQPRLRDARLAAQHNALAVARARLDRDLKGLALGHEARAGASVAAVAFVAGCGGAGGGFGVKMGAGSMEGPGVAAAVLRCVH
jgi:hypothetical protein